MADRDPTRRKDTRKADEYEDGESSAVRRRVARELTRQSGGGDGIPRPGIPGQDAPLLVHHLMGQQHGGSSGLQLQAPALGGSQLQPSKSGASASTATGATGPLPIRGNPPTKVRKCPHCGWDAGGRMVDHPRRHVCPCDVCLFAYRCKVCDSGRAGVPACMDDLPPPQPHQQRQQQGIPGQDAPLLVNQNPPHGQQQSGVASGGSTSREADVRQQLPQYSAMSTHRPTGQQRGEASRGTSTVQNWRPGLQLPPPPPPQAQGGPPVPGACGPLQIRGNPGQDAPAVNQPHVMGQQPGPGGRSFPHGLHLQAPISMNLQLQPSADGIPTCTICNKLLCICRQMRFRGNNQPPAQPISLKAMEWGERMAASIGKLRFRDDTGQKAGGSRAAVPSSMDLPPPQPGHQHPPPVGAGVQQLPYQPAVGNHPVEQHGEAPGGDAAQLEHPVLPADQPGPGPINEEQFDSCSACLEHPAPVRPQPRRHVCICPNCLSDTVECVVCNYDQ